jgi:uncharacterized protein (DUF169 family)
MADKEWRSDIIKLREALGLELSPVAVACLQGPAAGAGTPRVRLRICRAILDAASGKTLQLTKNTNACFGASWHLGFRKLDDPKAAALTRKFVVEGEKLVCSYDALDKLISQMRDVPDNSNSCFILSPVENADFTPQAVIFVCNAEEACRLLTLAVFLDGVMPRIKIGGPTCRMAIMEPLLSGELNVSFYDYASRKLCKVDKDKLIVSVPFGKIPGITANIDKCSAGTAKMEHPREVRDFLRDHKK